LADESHLHSAVKSFLTRFIHVKNMNNDDNLLKTSVIQ